MFIYIMMSLLFALYIIFTEPDVKVLEERRDAVVMVVFILFWPLTLLLIIATLMFEYYKSIVRKKVEHIHKQYLNNKALTLIEATPQELQLLLHASRLDVITIQDKEVESIQQAIANKSFEKYFLN